MEHPERPARARLWYALKTDPAFRATFAFAIVVPCLLCAGVVGWIVRAWLLDR